MQTGTRRHLAPGRSRLARPLRAAVTAAATAAMAALVLAGCVPGHPPGALSRSAGPVTVIPPARAASPSAPTVPLAQRTAEYWGSFFDNRHRTAGTQVRPATMILPGAIAAVGSSNAAQYALLTDGSLGPGAWAVRASWATASGPAHSPRPCGCGSRPG